MKNILSVPTNNALPSEISKWPVKRQWEMFSGAVGQIIDTCRYVIDDEVTVVQHSLLPTSLNQNPRACGVSSEYMYIYIHIWFIQCQLQLSLHPSQDDIYQHGFLHLLVSRMPLMNYTRQPQTTSSNMALLFSIMDS